MNRDFILFYFLSKIQRYMDKKKKKSSNSQCLMCAHKTGTKKSMCILLFLYHKESRSSNLYSKMQSWKRNFLNHLEYLKKCSKCIVIRKRILREEKQLNAHVHTKHPPSIFFFKAYFKQEFFGPQTTRIIYNGLRGCVCDK